MTPFPTCLAKKAVPFIPDRLLSHVVEFVLARMKRQHPSLFEDLAALEPFVVRFVPSDIPQQFVLKTGKDPVFGVALNPAGRADAVVSGSLDSLFAMLEGRVDGDTLFFERGIKVEGNMAAVVAVRNTLDRQEIDIYGEMLAACGPFRKEASLIITLADRALRDWVRARTEKEARHGA